MLNTSTAFRNAIANNSKSILKATLTLADGTVVELAGDDFIFGSASFSDGTSSGSSFDVGACVIGRFDATLNNRDGRFDAYVFAGAVIEPFLGVPLGDSVEWLRKGVYRVEQPEAYGDTVGISALDNMSLLERDYSAVNSSFPATLGEIVSGICAACSVDLATPSFDGYGYTVAMRPDDGAVTCLDMLSFAMQASGNFARCDQYGSIRVGWYDTAALESEDWLDGGTFDTDTTPYSDGDAADGGGFMTGGDAADGGGFLSNRYAVYHAFSSLTVATDDVVVTGVRVTARDEITEDGTRGADGETSLYGSEGYVLEFGDNPLVEYGRAATVAQQVGARVVGMRFRPFHASMVGDPALEAGDAVVLVDRHQRVYASYVTSNSYKVGGYQSISNDAETPSRNSAAGYSALTKAVRQARRLIDYEMTSRELALQRLARQLADAKGLYMTVQEAAGGGSVYYMHDKPLLADSQVVWKMTVDAIGISTDGGATYPYGLDSSGTAILERIYAIGLDADHIQAGTLADRTGTFSLNLETGVLSIGTGAGFGGSNVGDVLDAVNGAVAEVEVQFNSNQSNVNPPGETDAGWSTTPPSWQAGYYIWQRMATYTNGSATPEYGEPVCISGRDGATGTNSAVVMLYQRKSTAPSTSDIGTLTYTFATSALSGNMGAWSRNIPSGLDTCWVVMASAIGNGTTDTILNEEWSEPVQLSSTGVDGLNQATVFLFTRKKMWVHEVDSLVAPDSSSFSRSGETARIAGTVSGTTLTLTGDAPAKPASASYTFASGDLSPVPSGWSRAVPSGDDPLWVTTAAAISNAASVTIDSGDWADPQVMADKDDPAKVYSVRYAVGDSGTTAPTSGWQATVPSTAQGKWLWVRTTYTDGSTSSTCSYVGEDGKDGKSVYVQSATKVDKVTTVKLVDSDGNVTTMTIKDGDDGANGTPGPAGANGTSTYIHIAWANGPNGTPDFSTSESAGRTYIGSCTDSNEADPTTPTSYNWAKMTGENGVGIRSYVVQWYLSTSQSSATGSAAGWTSEPPTWQQGRYIWERTLVTFDDGSTKYAPSERGVLSKAVNKANEEAASASGKADTAIQEAAKANALVRPYNDGVIVCREGNSVGALVNADGSFDIVDVTWSQGVPTAGSTRYATFGGTTLIGNTTRGIQLNSSALSFLLEGERAFDVSYEPASTSGGTNWNMALNFMQGIFRCSTSGTRVNRLTADGYPVIFKDGSSLKYFDGTSTTPQVFPLGGSASTTVKIPNAVTRVTSSGVGISDLSITVNGAIAMWSGWVSGRASSQYLQVGTVVGGAQFPVRLASTVLGGFDGTDEMAFGGKLQVLTDGKVMLALADDLVGKDFELEFSMTWIRNG